MSLGARWLNDDERTSLANLASMISYHPQEMLYQQGTPILGLYFICTGLAKVARRTLQGKSRLIALVSDGKVPPYLLSRSKHLTYCMALSPTQVAFIERAALHGWLEGHPKATLSLLEQVSDESALGPIVEQVIDGNPETVQDYLGGRQQAVGPLVGQVMRLTRGKADPRLANRMLERKSVG